MVRERKVGRNIRPACLGLLCDGRGGTLFPRDDIPVRRRMDAVRSKEWMMDLMTKMLLAVFGTCWTLAIAMAFIATSLAR